jgi:hypothetical protein
VHEVDRGPLKNQRRRSARVSQSLPLVIRGVDFLGQPFEERTATLAFNLHGCRYFSKHHLRENAWITLAVRPNGESRNVRARVARSQRPRSVREFFQVAVELERPTNIWGLDFPPADWGPEDPLVPPVSGDLAPRQRDKGAGTNDFPPTVGKMAGHLTGHLGGTSRDSPLDPAFAEATSPPANSGVSEQPGVRNGEAWRDPSALLRPSGEQLPRQGRETAAARTFGDISGTAEDASPEGLTTAEGFLQRWKDEFERVHRGAQGEASEHWIARKQDLPEDLPLRFDQEFTPARHVIEPSGPAPAEDSRGPASASRRWRERLRREMGVAQAQWNELLQASIEGGIERLATQLSGHSKEVLRSAEQRLSECFNELGKPWAETAVEAHKTLNGIGAEPGEQIWRARPPVAEIDRVASDVAGHTQSRLDEAAQAAAASFGQVLEGTPDQETPPFTFASRNAVQGDFQEVERCALLVLSKLSACAEASVDQLRARIVSGVETMVSEARGALRSELASLRGPFAAERETRHREWAHELEQLSQEATARHQERLQAACDSSIASSMRRFNEHGQNTVASLIRLTEQALRESCSKVFEGLAEMMRNQNTSSAGAVAFGSVADRDAAESSAAQ